MESRQGSIVAAAPTRACCRSRLRAYAGHALPSHGAIPEMAHRPQAARLHLRAARSGCAARAESNFRRRYVRRRATQLPFSRTTNKFARITFFRRAAYDDHLVALRSSHTSITPSGTFLNRSPRGSSSTFCARPFAARYCSKMPLIAFAALESSSW